MADLHDGHDTTMEKQQQQEKQTGHRRERKSSRMFPCRFKGCDSIFYKKSHLHRHELIHNDVVRHFFSSFL